jgi:hypothetical protein
MGTYVGGVRRRTATLMTDPSGLKAIPLPQLPIPLPGVPPAGELTLPIPYFATQRTGRYDSKLVSYYPLRVLRVPNLLPSCRSGSQPVQPRDVILEEREEIDAFDNLD